jgi:alpha-beta hydrolase superfamily lysophospholipase
MDLRPGDGPRVPVYVWRAARPRGGVRAAVIRVHGGPAVQADRAWDRTTEYLLRNGIDVLQLNYRGSTGYGAPFERARGGDCARVRDLAAAVTLARDELGVPGERIILYGHSYGALLVAKAGRALPAPIGGVVLVSMTADADPASCGSGDDSLRPKRILAYHGANDYGLSPSQARRGVASLVGGGMLQRRRVHWRVFDREGHTFHRNATWARVYADIIAVLDRAS